MDQINLFCFSFFLFKVNEQIEKLSKNVVHLGIGTPNRILKLIESGIYLKLY